MPRFMVVVVLAVAGSVGCVQSQSVTCGSVICSQGRVCGPDGATCATQAQVAACGNAAEAAACSAAGVTDGVCRKGVCIDGGCGNGIVEAGEACDDGNRASFDGCRSDCMSKEMCGDGVAESAL